MARPTVTWRSAIFSTSNSASPYTATTAWTPAANSLIVAFVTSCATSPADPTSVSAHGVSLTKVASGLALSSTHLLSVWVGDAGGSPSNAAASATIGGTPTGAVVDEFEVTNWQTAGGAIAAVTLNNSGTGSGTSGSLAVRLLAETVNESAWLSYYNHITNETSTGQGGNWTATAGGTGNYNTPATSAIGQDNDTGYTLTATASWSTSASWAALLLRVLGLTDTAPSESLEISDTVTARLNPQPVSVDSENLKISDGPVTGGGLASNLTIVVDAENLKLADGGVATQQGIVQLLGVIHVQDTVSAAIVVTDLSRQISPDETLKLADTVTVDLPLQPGLLLEGLRVSDQPPFIEERLRLTDSVTAQIGGADLTRTVADEVLKLADTVTALENPLQTSQASESLKVVDTVTVFENPLQTSTPNESLKVIDTLTQPVLVSTGDLARNVGDEPLKLADGGVATQQGIVQLLGVIDVQDTVSVLMGNNLTVTVTGEVLYVQDGTPTPLAEKSDKYVSLTETLYLDDIGLVAAFGIDEILHCVDQTPIVQRVGGGDLTTPTLVENLKVQDSATVLENPLFAAPAVESLKVQDSVTVSENPLFASPAVDSLKVQDSVTTSENPLFTAVVDEPVKVADSVTLLENPLFAAPALENLKIQDQTPAAAAGGISVVVTDELLHVQDSATLSENPFFVTVTNESLKVQDSATVSENPLLTSTLAESLKVQDQGPQASMGGLFVTITPDELLHVVDTVQASMGGLFTTVAVESLIVQDTASTFENPEFAAPALENLKITDTVQAGLAISATPAGENLKLADTVTAAVGLSASTPTESLKVSDAVSALLTVLPVVIAAENIKVSDSVQLGVDLLSVVVTSENLEIRDLWLVEGSRRVVVRVKSRK